MSGEELALKVGYKTQSGISNLENRAVSNGGGKLPKIAEVLDVAIAWLLQGPDTEDMASVPRFGFHSYVQQASPEHIASDNTQSWPAIRTRAHTLVDQISEKGLIAVVDLMEAVAERHPRTENGAGVPLPARRNQA